MWARRAIAVLAVIHAVHGVCNRQFHASPVSEEEAERLETYFTALSVPSPSECAIACSSAQFCRSAIYDSRKQTCAISYEAAVDCGSTPARFTEYSSASSEDVLIRISCVKKCARFGDSSLESPLLSSPIAQQKQDFNTQRQIGIITGNPHDGFYPGNAEGLAGLPQLARSSAHLDSAHENENTSDREEEGYLNRLIIENITGLNLDEQLGKSDRCYSTIARRYLLGAGFERHSGVTINECRCICAATWSAVKGPRCLSFHFYGTGECILNKGTHKGKYDLIEHHSASYQFISCDIEVLQEVAHRVCNKGETVEKPKKKEEKKKFTKFPTSTTAETTLKSSVKTTTAVTSTEKTTSSEKREEEATPSTINIHIFEEGVTERPVEKEKEEKEKEKEQKEKEKKEHSAEIETTHRRKHNKHLRRSKFHPHSDSAGDESDTEDSFETTRRPKKIKRKHHRKSKHGKHSTTPVPSTDSPVRHDEVEVEGSGTIAPYPPTEKEQEKEEQKEEKKEKKDFEKSDKKEKKFVKNQENDKKKEEKQSAVADKTPEGTLPVTPTTTEPETTTEELLTTEATSPIPTTLPTAEECFERIQDYMLTSTAGGLEHDVSLEECRCFCANSKLSGRYQFQCLSATYYHNERDCVLNLDNRQGRPDLFERQYRARYNVSYLGLRCAPTHAVSLFSSPSLQHGCVAAATEAPTTLPTTTTQRVTERPGRRKGVNSDSCFLELPSFVLEGTALAVETGISYGDCKCACAYAVARYGEACHSTQYYYDSQTCLLSKMNRFSNPEAFNFVPQPSPQSFFEFKCAVREEKKAAYIANHCSAWVGKTDEENLKKERKRKKTSTTSTTTSTTPSTTTTTTAAPTTVTTTRPPTTPVPVTNRPARKPVARKPHPAPLKRQQAKRSKINFRIPEAEGLEDYDLEMEGKVHSHFDSDNSVESHIQDDDVSNSQGEIEVSTKGWSSDENEEDVQTTESPTSSSSLEEEASDTTMPSTEVTEGSEETTTVTESTEEATEVTDVTTEATEPSTEPTEATTEFTTTEATTTTTEKEKPTTTKKPTTTTTTTESPSTKYPPSGRCTYAAHYQTAFQGRRLIKVEEVDSPMECFAACHYHSCRSANLANEGAGKKSCQLFRDALIDYRRPDVLQYDGASVYFDGIRCDGTVAKH